MICFLGFSFYLFIQRFFLVGRNKCGLARLFNASISFGTEVLLHTV